VSAEVQLEDRGPIRILTLDRPAKRNALNPAALEALAAALAVAPQVRALLVQGRGTAFCSGYDIEELPEATAEGPLPDERLGEVLELLERFPAPSVALVRGPAFGAGCELAAACDFRIADETAVLCMPPARLGVVYAPNGLHRIVALAGRSKAKLLFLTGRRVEARQSLEWGLLDEVHPVAEAGAAAERLCEELAAGAPLAVQGMKKSFAVLTQHPLGDRDRGDLRRLRREAFQSEDAREGRAAFLEKRPPRFTGH
jgi:enoyl-CoA hydratase/carnithine racemase